MNNTTIPVPLKAQMVRYGHYKGQDMNNESTNKASDQMRDALDSVEDSLNNLGDALKNRFRELLVSQMSLLRRKEINTDTKLLPIKGPKPVSHEIVSEEPSYTKRCNLKAVHFDDSNLENFDEIVSTRHSEAGAGTKFKGYSERNLYKKEEYSPKHTEIKQVCFNKRGIREKSQECKSKAARSRSNSPVRVSLMAQMKSKYGEQFAQNDDIKPATTDKLETNDRRSPLQSRPISPIGSPLQSRRISPKGSPLQSRRISPKRIPLQSRRISPKGSRIQSRRISPKGSPLLSRCISPKGCSACFESIDNMSWSPVSSTTHRQTDSIERRGNVMRNVLTHSAPKEQRFVPRSLLATQENKVSPLGTMYKSNFETNMEQFPSVSGPTFQEQCGTFQQIQKRQLLNAVTTLICATHDAVKQMSETDFDTDIWTAIHKNVSDIEAELETFNNSLITDDILPPEVAMKEAEGRLKTRLNVLFNINKGCNGFFASDASKRDIMENVQRLKSSSCRFGAASQHELMLNEMRFILKEIKDLAECFQICGARFTRRLTKDNAGRMKETNLSFADNDYFSASKNVIQADTYSALMELKGSGMEQSAHMDDQDGCSVRKSSSLEALSQWCSSIFDKLSDVQKAVIILLLVAFIVFVLTELLSGACTRIRTFVDMWNNVTILHFGPPIV